MFRENSDVLPKWSVAVTAQEMPSNSSESSLRLRRGGHYCR